MWSVFMVKALLALWQASLMSICEINASGSGKLFRGFRTQLLPKFYNIRGCEDKNHSYVQRNVTYEMLQNGYLMVNIDFETTSSAQRLERMKVIITRCALGVDGQCEYFDTWDWRHGVCGLLSTKYMLWTPLVEKFRPPFQCPVKKGRFTAENATLDLENADRLTQHFHLENYAWPYQIQLYNERGLYLCVDTVFEARRIRVKER